VEVEVEAAGVGPVEGDDGETGLSKYEVPHSCRRSRCGTPLPPKLRLFFRPSVAATGLQSSWADWRWTCPRHPGMRRAILRPSTTPERDDEVWVCRFARVEADGLSWASMRVDFTSEYRTSRVMVDCRPGTGTNRSGPGARCCGHWTVDGGGGEMEARSSRWRR
jgi:hypothetical protein